MSKERARRRAAREHEAALRTAARASEQERRERQGARRRALKAATTDRIRLAAPAGRDTGALARKRRKRNTMLVVVLVCLNILVWVVRPDWEARLAAFVVTVLAFPVLRLLLFSRR